MYLILPVRGLRDKVSAGYISRIVKSVISDAYQWAQIGLNNRSAQAKDLRKMAASLTYHLGKPLPDVLRAAGWSNPGTFIRHYMVAAPLSTQKTLVAGGSVVDGSSN